MRPEYAELIRRRLAVPLVEGPDRVTTLEAAVRRLVEPGQTIYAGAAHGRPNARDGDFLAADDPFAGVDGPTADAAASPTATRIGFVRALVPDVALFHAWAADRAGNVLAAAPLNENFYAAMAARRGAIVTVEKIG